MMTAADQMLICDDCQQEFVFTPEVQAIYAKFPVFHVPRRCANCVQTRLVERAASRRRVPLALPARQRAQRVVACRGCGQEMLVSYAPRHGRLVYCESCLLGGRQSDAFGGRLIFSEDLAGSNREPTSSKPDVGR